MGARDLDSTHARGLDQRSPLVSPAVVVRALGVEMAENDLRPGFLPDPDPLCDRFQVSERRVCRAEVPVVGIVDRPRVLRGDPVELDHLLGLGVVARQVKQPGRQAVGPLLHALPHEVTHCVQFLTSRRAVLHPHHLAPHPVVSDEEECVHTYPPLLPTTQPRGDLGAAAPVHPQRHAGNPLVKKGASVTPVVCVQLGMGVHVDKAGCHDESGHVKGVLRLDTGCRRVTHKDDAVARHRDIGGGGLVTGAIQHRTSPQ